MFPSKHQRRVFFVLTAIALVFLNIQQIQSFTYSVPSSWLRRTIHATSSSMRLPRRLRPLQMSIQTSLPNDDSYSNNSTRNEDLLGLLKEPKNGYILQRESSNDDSSKSDTESIESFSSASVSSSYQLPTYRTLIVYTLATVAIWMAEPLLSLVDTTVVGLTQGATSTVQVASMGPATTLFDSVLYGCWFLAVATTSQVAQAVAKEDYQELQTVVRNVLGVSLSLGLGVSAFLMLFGPVCLDLMVRDSVSAASLVHYASQYTRIRALVAIAAIASQVLQSTCLATLDVRTPAIAVVVASVINIVGDLLLSPTMGVAGAAWATAAATLASTGILFRAVAKQMRQWEVMTNNQEQTQGPLDDDDKDTLDVLPTERSAIKTITSMLSLPNGKQFMKLLRLSGPLFYAINAKIACYSALTIRGAPFGVTALAALNIMMRIFCSFACFGYSLSQAAQSFVPAALLSENNETKQHFRGVMKRLLLIGTIMAIINQGATFILSQFGKLFTTDPGVIALLHDSNIFLGLALVLHPITMLLEGAVIGMRDFKSLVATYTIALGVHLSVLRFLSNTLTEVWRAFFLFQFVIMGLYGACIWTRKRVNNQIMTRKNALMPPL